MIIVDPHAVLAWDRGIAAFRLYAYLYPDDVTEIKQLTVLLRRADLDGDAAASTIVGAEAGVGGVAGAEDLPIRWVEHAPPLVWKIQGLHGEDQAAICFRLVACWLVGAHCEYDAEGRFMEDLSFGGKNNILADEEPGFLGEIESWMVSLRVGGQAAHPLPVCSAGTHVGEEQVAGQLVEGTAHGEVSSPGILLGTRGRAHAKFGVGAREQQQACEEQDDGGWTTWYN